METCQVCGLTDDCVKPTKGGGFAHLSNYDCWCALRNDNYRELNLQQRVEEDARQILKLWRSNGVRRWI